MSDLLRLGNWNVLHPTCQAARYTHLCRDQAVTLDGFEWDWGNCQKCQKHGVSLAEIESVLSGRPAILPDLEHSQVETRFLAIGRNSEGRHLFIAFTIRERDGDRYLRPISARYMHQNEVDHYEATHS